MFLFFLCLNNVQKNIKISGCRQLAFIPRPGDPTEVVAGEESNKEIIIMDC